MVPDAAAASPARRLRPEVSKNSSTALSSNEGELARSITTCAPAMASLRPSRHSQGGAMLRDAVHRFL
jgi:hypothetical protein